MASQQQDTLHSPTSLWYSWRFWLRVLGVGLALVGGIAIGVILNTGWGVVAIVIAPLVGFGSACLLRSWWAMLIVPVVSIAGIFLVLTLVGIDLLHIGTSDLNEVVGFTAILGVLPAVVGAVIGTPIGVFWKKRQPL